MDSLLSVVSDLYGWVDQGELKGVGQSACGMDRTSDDAMAPGTAETEKGLDAF